MLGELGRFIQKKMKLYHQLTPYIRINSKWMKDLLSCDTIKVLVKNIASKIEDAPYSNIFANISSRAKEKNKTKQMALHQTKKLLQG